MDRFYTVRLVVIGLAAGSGSAFAQSAAPLCFDKGRLTYVACEPSPAALPAAPPAPAPAAPIPDEGLYLGLKGGVVFAEDTDFSVTTGLAMDVENGYEPGYALGGLVGYDFGEVAAGVGLRADIEIGYQSAEIDAQRAAGVALASPAGETNVFYGFMNLYGDIALLERLDLVLGGGVGLGRADFAGHAAGGAALLDLEESAFGYHLDAGLAVDLTRRWTLAGTYRFSSFLDVDLEQPQGGGLPGVAGQTNIDSHQVLGEIRYGF